MIFYTFANKDRRIHYDLSATKVTKPSLTADENFRDREAILRNTLKNKYVYRVPLKSIGDLGKVNYPTKIDIQIRLILETDMKKLFETDVNFNNGLKTGKSSTSMDLKDYNSATPGTPDAQIVLIKGPMIQYDS